MAGFSDYLEAALLNVSLRNTAFTEVAQPYVALHSADPGDDGSNELSGNGYARVAMSFDAPAAGVCQNSAEVTLGPATGGAWSEATHVSLWDADTAGNCLYAGELTTAKTVAEDDSAQFAAGALTVTLT